MINLKLLIEQDCQTLFERALLGDLLCAFGEDGCGVNGAHDIPMYFPVKDIIIDVSCLDDSTATDCSATLSILLDGYNADVVGHIQSDQNFEISLTSALAKASIKRDVLEWLPLHQQAPFCVSFKINLADLLGWP